VLKKGVEIGNILFEEKEVGRQQHHQRAFIERHALNRINKEIRASFLKYPLHNTSDILTSSNRCHT